MSRWSKAGRVFGIASLFLLAAGAAVAQVDGGGGTVPSCMGTTFVKGPGSCATPTGTGGTVQSGDSPAVGQYQGAGSTTIGPATISGDASLAAGGALTVTKSGGVAFGTGAFANTGTSGATIPLNNGNLTLSGTDNFTGTFEVGGFALTMNGAITLPAAPGSTQCLHISTGGSITPTGSDCGSGGGGGSGTVNTGSNPAIAQYIGASSTTVGPATVSGDATLANGGALTLATVNAGPGATTCSNITTNAKGLVTANVSGSCGGSPGFNTIGSGSNTTAAMLVGTGSSLGVSGSGTIAATAVPAAGITGTIAAATMLPLPSAQLYIGNGSALPAAVALSGDCTIANTGAITCTKSSGTGFGTAAFVNTGTTGGTVGLLNANLTLSGTDTFSGTDNFTGTFEIGGFSLGLGGNTTLPAAPVSTSCLHMASTGAVTATSADCSAAVVNSGSSPAIAQYQGSGSTTVGAATVSGDGSLAAGGALTIASIGGKAVTLGGTLTTTGTGAATLAFPNTTASYTFPTATATLLSAALPSTDLFVGNGSGVATGVALSGDCTLANTGAITCTKTGGTAFTSIATATVPLSGALGGTGVANTGLTLTLGGNTTLPAAPGSTQCLHMSSAGAVTATGSDCAAGAGGGVTAKTANYTVLTGDVGTSFVYNCAASYNCSITLPTTNLFSTGTGVSVSNNSLNTAVPILPVGTPTTNSSCSAGACSGTTFTSTYTVAAQHSRLAIFVRWCVSPASGCGSSTPTLSSVSDSLGNTCAVIVQNSGGGSGREAAVAECYNTATTGADTITFHMSGTGANFAHVTIQELSGVALTTPAEVSASATGTGTSASVATSTNPTLRGDLIFGGLASNPGTVTPSQTTISPGENAQYLRTNGPQIYTLDWGLGTSVAWTAVVAAIPPANAISDIAVCFPTGAGAAYGNFPLIANSCSTNPGTLLKPGASVNILQDASNNYSFKLDVPNVGVDDVTADITATQFHCFDTLDVMSWVGTPPVISLPASGNGLFPGCTINLVQVGTQPASFLLGTGAAWAPGSTPNLHTGGQGAAGFVQYQANGQWVQGGTFAP